VATRVGAAPEILADADLGIVVDPTPESICDGLRQALDGTWNQSRLVGFASSRTWESVAAAMEDFLRNSTQRKFSAVNSYAAAQL
jgi:glycosyltransferase involved in cell wall biosynthesis